MVIKILGTGCPNCVRQEKAVIAAVKNLNADVKIEKVTSIDDIMDYGVMMTPALVIDEKIVSMGKILPVEKIESLIKKG